MWCVFLFITNLRISGTFIDSGCAMLNTADLIYFFNFQKLQNVNSLLIKINKLYGFCGSNKCCLFNLHFIWFEWSFVFMALTHDKDRFIFWLAGKTRNGLYWLKYQSLSLYTSLNKFTIPFVLCLAQKCLLIALKLFLPPLNHSNSKISSQFSCKIILVVRQFTN